MIIHYTHSRAAILCFGGWGLQVLFHLLPRLQAAQEQRTALDAAGPNLNNITSFGAVAPESLLDGERQASFSLLAPKLDRPLAPFHVERLIATIRDEDDDGIDRRAASLLSDAEKRALLLQRALKPHLRALSYGDGPFRSPATGLASLARHGAQTGNGVRRATRADMFHTALEHADPVSRLLETHLIDPIRQDNLAPDDPFVQTTLYVIAPLFEPLAGALIWPTVAQLMARLGRQHISQVVGFFATGSYATDLTRAVEDSAAYATLAELEVLAGLRPAAPGNAMLHDLIRSANRPLYEQVGQRLFDHIYLLDREKSNQGLAQDSQELALMVGNALEAMIVASGDLFIQEQLGIGLHIAAERPYSLIGAAGDYAPIDQILHAVNRQVESRLVREWVLRASPTEQVAASPLQVKRKASDLTDFGWTRAAARGNWRAARPISTKARRLHPGRGGIGQAGSTADARRLSRKPRAGGQRNPV